MSPSGPRGAPVTKSVVFRLAAVTKYHGLGSLNSQDLFSHSFGGWQI